jgi:hypothetical protein
MEDFIASLIDVFGFNRATTSSYSLVILKTLDNKLIIAIYNGKIAVMCGVGVVFNSDDHIKIIEFLDKYYPRMRQNLCKPINFECQ